MSLTSWWMCGLSGESGTNFGEFTPRSNMRDRGLTICDQWKTLKIFLSACFSSMPSYGMDNLLICGWLMSANASLNGFLLYL